MDSVSIIIITLSLSALFSGLEIAFISANKLKIEVDKKKGMYYARLLSELSRTPSRFLGSMLVANNIVVVIYGIMMERVLGEAFLQALPSVFATAIWILIFQTLVSTLIILVFGEFIPKTLFRINSNGVLKFFVLPSYVFYHLLYPVVYVFTVLSEKVLKFVFKVPFVTKNYVFTMVDLDNYLKEFTGKNPVPSGERDTEIQMFQNAIDFHKVKVRECMVPRTDIKALNQYSSLQEVMDLSVQTGHSKILIFEDTIDNIIGYTHAFDFFSHPLTLHDIIKPIQVIPESMMAKQALQMLLLERRSIALVVDEFGGTSGIVTMEDIIEEILGEISDEYDKEDRVDRQVGKNEYLFSGRLEIDYINEKYHLQIPESEDYETLAGFILHHQERIPEIDDEILIDPFVITITEASEKRIETVKLVYNG